MTADYSFLLTPRSSIGCGLYLGAVSVLRTEFEWVVQWQMALRPAMAIASSCVLWTVFQVLTKGRVARPKRTRSPDRVEGVTSDLVRASSRDVTCDWSREGLGVKRSRAWSCAPLVVTCPFSGSRVGLGWVKVRLVCFVASL
jgi:hypothetical protein